MICQIHKPIHIIGQSRIDTWQKYQTPIASNQSRIIHRPIQIEGKSRVDTWQRLTRLRRAHSATEVRNSLIEQYLSNVFF